MRLNIEKTTAPSEPIKEINQPNEQNLQELTLSRRAALLLKEESHINSLKSARDSFSTKTEEESNTHDTKTGIGTNKVELRTFITNILTTSPAYNLNSFDRFELAKKEKGEWLHRDDLIETLDKLLLEHT
jgi:hypothetical protein